MPDSHSQNGFFPSNVLVLVQLFAIGYLVVNADMPPRDPYIIALFALGLYIGFLSVWTMRKTKWSIAPVVSENAKLVTNGPYSKIRNPMYLAVLLVCYGLYMGNPTLIGFLVYAVLAADLLVKIQYEEKQLSKKFPEYAKYMQKTKRLIPFIY